VTLDFSDLKVLLIGDFMVDMYVYGYSTRMSPEAPVPVFIPKKSFFSPGGAGNVAMNLSSLGANVSCVGCVGNDKNGLDLINYLKKENINCKNIQIIDEYDTTTKTRFILNDNQVMRVDEEKELGFSWEPFSMKNLKYNIYDIIIFSDYNKGVLNSNWFSNITGKNIFVDPKKSDFSFYSNASIITPNLNELQRASTIEINDSKSVVKACKEIIKNSNLEYIIAKKGNQGMTIVGKDNFIKHIRAHPVNSPDVTGAGDTVISALSLAYAKTGDIEKSAKFANAAASIVVDKIGTATVNIDEIKNLS
jgi:D-beta-D-heptose 7-phosphate kinase/D-beta-D-heptose 1-phosphate adenosyltransferase